jgi:CRP-like cAMP-binding protein
VSYLESGTVGQYDISESGNKLMLTIYKPGAFFPMAHAVNNTPNRYFFEALEPVTVRQAPAAEAVAFVREHPDVLFDLLQRLYRGMDGLLGRLAQLMAGTAQGVLTFELSIMRDRFGEKNPGGTFVKVTAAQLAAQTGLARETVSRELHRCAQTGMLEVVKGGILIKHMERRD